MLFGAGLGLGGPGLSAAERSRPAPPFPGGANRWIGRPANWPALRGQVVLLDVWTFG